MDQNGDIPGSDTPFSFQRLLRGDDWHRWDTFPTVDDSNDDSSPDPTVVIHDDDSSSDPTVVINDDGPEIEFDPSIITRVARGEMVQQWLLRSFLSEQFEASSYGENIEVSYDVEVPYGEEIITYEELLDLTEQIGDVCIGLKAEFIDENLSQRKYEDCGETEKCVICLSGLKYNEEASKLGCGHDFHFECIKKWLMVKNLCPLCKQDVF